MVNFALSLSRLLSIAKTIIQGLFYCETLASYIKAALQRIAVNPLNALRAGLLRCKAHQGTKLYCLEETLMAVRAKVVCNEKTAQEVGFTTVYEPDATKDTENARFTKATPWGTIRMGIDNPTAMAQFELGKEYYVDFIPVS